MRRQGKWEVARTASQRVYGPMRRDAATPGACREEVGADAQEATPCRRATGRLRKSL